PGRSADVPLHNAAPCFHQSGSASVEPTRISAVIPSSWLTSGGGTNEAYSVNGPAKLELHANVLVATPAAPHSSHDRFTLPGGSGPTRNALSELADPPGLVTTIGPVVAPVGTVARTSESFETVNVAASPLNFTDVVRRKLTPLIEMLVPTGACLGRNDAIRGATMNALSLAALP